MSRVEQTFSPVNLALVLAALVVGGGCSGPADPEPRVATTITITPATAALEDAGESVQLTAAVTDQDGQAMDDVRVVWSTDDVLIAEVSARGVVKGGEFGKTTATASTDSLSATAEITVKPGQRAVLHVVYRKMNGDGWRENTNWKTDAPLDEWHGVNTDAGGTITELEMHTNQVTAAIAPELGMLPTLGSLIIRANPGVTGSIPPELGNLRNLERLAIVANGVTGPIPAELGNLQRLEQLRLDQNSLTGPIPAELGNLPNLEWLVVEQNALTGPIPAQLGDLPNLEWLILSQNDLTGSIPPQLGNLATLESLSLNHNDLTGPLPGELGNLRNLLVLLINDNLLTGRLPEELIGIPLIRFDWNNTDLCAPTDDAFQQWLSSIGNHTGNRDCP